MVMKLYNLGLSNFAGKCRVAIYEKGLDVELADPPGGPGSDAYKKINPTGKIPALETDDGQVILESEVINEYLEDKFPATALLPSDAEGRAAVRAITRYHDLYIDPPMRAVFPKLFGQDLDDAFIAKQIAEVNDNLDQLESSISDGPWATGDNFTLADAALAPTLFLMDNLLPNFGSKKPFDGRPKLGAWWQRIQDRPSTKKVLGEQGAAMAALMKK